MNDKEKYVREQISTHVQYWISKMLLLGIIFFPLIGVADYFLTPENLPRFMLYRAGITGILAGAYFLNRAKRSIRYQYTLITVCTILSAIVIETMILQFGGHSSPYYAGLCLLIIAALGLIPYGFFLSLSVGVIIYLIYLFPIFLLDTIIRPSAFIANNIFMICTFVLALTWRTLSQKSMINEISLQYDLIQDKSKLEQAMVALNKSELWHRSLFENATDGIIVTDRNGIIVNVNRRTCTMHGFSKEELSGASIRLLQADPDSDALMTRMDRLLHGESLLFETVNRRKDGSAMPVEVSAKAIMSSEGLFVHSFYRDVSEKKRLQEHLLQSQKMESIGILAGGVAHDFNNTLSVILGNTEIVQSSEGLDARAVRCLSAIENASIKAGDMISKLLGFARKSSYEFVPLNLNQVVDDTVKLLERVVGKTISLTVELDNRLPLIQGDVNQIEQIIMNFVVNSRDAMPEGKGKITVKTVYREITKEMPEIPPFVPPGPYVVLSVTDTGIGIPDDIKSSIFEPFFTTKERGKGTGLGLSMVYGAVKEHKGYIDVQSAVGRGSTFAVYLPAVRPDAEQRTEKPDAALSGNETLLVVDDEVEILNTIRDTLAARGYKPVVFNDAIEALEAFRKDPDEIAMVITDIVMPRIDGREFIDKIKAVRPAIKILAVSGYSNYVAEKEEIRTIDGFLKKPFHAVFLLSAVRHILDGKNKEILAG